MRPDPSTEEDGDRASDGPAPSAAVVTVVFSAAQSRSTGGETEIEIDAGRVDHLIRALCERYAALEGHLEHAAVSVDGVLHNDAMYVNLPDGAEVQFIGAVAGGSGDSVVCQKSAQPKPAQLQRLRRVSDLWFRPTSLRFGGLNSAR
jgi:molybdopterin converting factor small subunit